MNFFDAQYEAKQKTRNLLVLFFSSVLTVSVLIGISLALYLKDSFDTENMELTIFVYSSLGSFGFISIVSLIKTESLRRNPSSIFANLGGIEISGVQEDFIFEQYLNIVEEMSIASGVPIPSVYYLPDSSINAFACGFDIHNAGICVTRGALENLTRDELQAVVAHEFSHILNGDMNLNLKLTGTLAGLLIIFKLGRLLLRSSGRRSRKKGNGAAGIGAIFFALGGIGYLVAGWLKSKISKEREYLADASSVQFTRNPDSMVGVLVKIMANVQGSQLKSSHVDDASHMCISDPTKSIFSFETHPATEKRILAIKENYNVKELTEENLLKVRENMYSIQRERQDPLRKKKTKKEEIIGPESFKSAMSYLGPMFFFLNKLPQGQVSADKSIADMIIPFMQNELDEIKNLNTDTKIHYLEAVVPFIRRLDSTEKEQIYKSLKEEVIKDSKIKFMEFLILSYLRPVLVEEKLPIKDLSSNKFYKYASMLLSYLYYEGDSTDINFIDLLSEEKSINFILKSELGYLNIMESLKWLRFAKPKDKELLCKLAKKIIVSDSKISDKERLIFCLITQSIGVPGLALKDV